MNGIWSNNNFFPGLTDVDKVVSLNKGKAEILAKVFQKANNYENQSTDFF